MAQALFQVLYVQQIPEPFQRKRLRGVPLLPPLLPGETPILVTWLVTHVLNLVTRFLNLVINFINLGHKLSKSDHKFPKYGHKFSKSGH